MGWDKEEAQIFRDMIVHESNVVNHRLTWLFTLNGFFFAALAFAWKDGKELIPYFSTLGALVSVSILLPIYASNKAMDRFVEKWDEMKSHDFDGLDIIGYRPVRKTLRPFRVLQPWYFTPFILSVFWLVILARALFR